MKLKFYNERTFLDGNEIKNINSLNLNINPENIVINGNAILTLELEVDFDGSTLTKEEIQTIQNNIMPSVKDKPFPEIKENVSTRLKQIMSDRNLRQADIIELCQPYCKQYNVRLGRNDLSQYVSGKVEPGKRKLTVLSLALNVNEAWLMGFDNSMEIG